jgi:hypothetical protein
MELELYRFGSRFPLSHQRRSDMRLKRFGRAEHPDPSMRGGTTKNASNGEVS